jgi:hypothetical protein
MSVKFDLTTKFLLTLIAVGLFLNAIPAFTQVAHALESVWIDGGRVGVYGDVGVSGSVWVNGGEVACDVGSSKYTPIYVNCVNCN